MSQDAIRMMRWSALLGGGALLFTSPTLAQEDACASDADCEHGYTCEVIGGWGGCSVEPCDPDGVCPPPVCESHDLLGCVPGPCASDSDCAEGMVCHTSTYSRCSGGGYAGPDCSPGADCPDLPPPEPASCEEITESQCTPRYQLPCTADADCGEGFRCTEAIYYECDGGGSDGGTTGFGASSGITGAWDGSDEGGDAEEGEAYGTRSSADEPTGAATPAVDGPADYTCREVPSGEFYCELLELPCEVDADCPATMHCQDNDVVCSSPDPAGPPPPTGGGEGPTQAYPGFAEEAAAVAAEQDVAPYEPDCRVLEGEPAKICRPDGYGGGGAAGGSVTGVGGETAEDGMGEGAPTGGSGDADNGGAATGGSGRDGSEGGDLHDWLRDAGGRHGHGCTIAEAESDAGENLSLLLGVGLALGWMQRRRTR